MITLQHNDQYIGQLLVRDGVITHEELERGLSEQKKDKGFLCSHLVRLGFATEEKIFSILSLQIGVPYLSLKEARVDPAVLNRVPGNFALACQCVPFKVVDDCFYVAMANPMNSQATKEVQDYLGVDKLKVFLSGDDDIREAIKKYYGV